jgi:hypothetical protein
MNDTVEISGTGTVSEDGLMIESAQFYQKDIDSTYGNEVIEEIQISAIPYGNNYAPSPLHSSYPYKVKGASVPGSVEILKHNEYTSGELYKTMTSYGFSGTSQIDLTFWKE